MRHTGTVGFETKRLVCRRFVRADCGDVLENWASDPLVQHEYGEPVYSTPEEVEGLLAQYIAGYERPDFYRWAVIEKASGKNIGQIAFCRVYSGCRTAEIEYCIGRAFRGRGYAGEALAGLLEHIFPGTEFEKLEAYHRAENVSSGRVLEKSLMHRTDTVTRFAQEDKAPVGEFCYCITSQEWKAAQNRPDVV